MRILGIDPGVATIGFGIIDIQSKTLNTVSYGAITTPSNLDLGKRLVILRSNLLTLIETYKPDVCGIEEIYFSKNVKTAISVSHARGVILCLLEEYNIPASHYTPTAVKSAITGYGNAEKKQIQYMTKEILNLNKVPKPDDVADALAIAVCHYHSSSLKSKL